MITPNQKILLVVFLFVVCYACKSLAGDCGRFKITPKYMRNCQKSDIKKSQIEFVDLTFSFTSACKLVPRGCIKIKKDLSDSAKMDISVKKVPILDKTWNDVSLCEALEKKEVSEFTSRYQAIHKHCPLSAGTYCIKANSTDLSSNSKQLPLLKGTTVGKIVFKEGSTSSPISCLEFEISVK